ncbi:Murein DD-endopeptidase MepM [Lacunisphaera limnophila]|uniref:Murein DD-endopeptidase MepM n=1 Tax=Lacunisphaera limnophila TaxID=1838286 RepID=A0A1I7PHY3_9BACT|nr:M23 family metallopeptidase [Lacunisphaera limnophila]AOS43232.1 Murein DD-endopeptidase MepM [Lacunisphaera limnophila]
MRRLLLALLLAVRLAGANCDDPGIRVTEERQGDIVRLYAETTTCLDLTFTLTADLQNIRTSAPLPATVESRGSPRFLLLELRPAAPGQAWSYRYRYHWQYGGRGGEPDDTAYRLPFAGSHRLQQGYRGSFSHQRGSPNEHAHDWVMPVGTPVLAARGGTVVGVRQDSTTGGPSETYKQCANYVIIRHADGTYAEYLHLQTQGVEVRLGDEVQAGQRLARSGNTGWSTNPHLHFAVFRTVDGQTRETLPVRFRLKDGTVQPLHEGRTY